MHLLDAEELAIRPVWLSLETTGLDPIVDVPMALALRAPGGPRCYIVQEPARQIPRLQASPKAAQLHAASGILSVWAGQVPTSDRTVLGPLDALDAWAQSIAGELGAGRPAANGDPVALALAGVDLPWLRPWLERYTPGFVRMISRAHSIDFRTIRTVSRLTHGADFAREKTHRPLDDCYALADEFARWRSRFVSPYCRAPQGAAQ